MVQGSEREAAEAQMTYGVHVFARAKVIPDLAIERGQQAYDEARAMGDRALEFLAAIGTTHAYLEVEDAQQAERWLERAGILRLDRAHAAPRTPGGHGRRAARRFTRRFRPARAPASSTSCAWPLLNIGPRRSARRSRCSP